METKNAVFVGAFLLFFAVGLGVVNLNSEKYQIARDPAAIRQNYDFTHLRGDVLTVAAKERLINGFDIEKNENEIAFSVGHFAFLNPNGEKTLACHAYDSVSLTFEADGIAVDGERPQMVITGGCELKQDISVVQPVVIPYAEIFSQSPADGEFKFNLGNSTSTVNFSHVSDTWPRRWILTGVKLHSQKASLEVDRQEIRKIIGQPTVISF